MIRYSAGICGLPNVGKSTLFNALTQSQLANASNFPFCTIEPNVARVVVPDPRLDQLARLTGSEKTVYSSLELHDIAGLIKGASKGDGLGNQFLGNIRGVSLIVHVLRCYENSDIIHVAADEAGRSDPIEDMETIETELLLADLDSVEKRLEKKIKEPIERNLLESVQADLAAGKPARDTLLASVATTSTKPASKGVVSQDPLAAMRHNLFGQLLTAKPTMYLCNTDEDGARDGGNAQTRAVAVELSKRGLSAEAADPVVICARLEEEALTLFDNEDDRMEYLAEFGLKETGLSKVAQRCAGLLGRSVFYTAGPQETRAWDIPAVCRAQDAAAKIHTDISRGFIAAETVSFDDYVKYNGEAGAKEAGKLRTEGRDYLVQSGDVMNFKFNV